jgi:hypothetical protein
MTVAFAAVRESLYGTRRASSAVQKICLLLWGSADTVGASRPLPFMTHLRHGLLNAFTAQKHGSFLR